MSRNIKIASVFFIIVLLLNMVLFGMRKISAGVFWKIIIIGAVFAYFVNRINRK